MDWAATVYLVALVGAIQILILNYNTTSAFDVPVHLTTLGLGAAGLGVLLLNFYLPDRFITPSVANEESAIPLAESRKRSGTLGKRDEDQERELVEERLSRQRRGQFSFRRLRWKLLVAFVAICLRMRIFYVVQAYVECAVDGITPWVPLMVTLYESSVLYFSNHDHLRLRSAATTMALRLKSGPKVRVKDVKIVALVFVLTLSGLSLMHQFAPPRSSYICAGQATHFPSIPLLQSIGAILDVIIIICASESIFWGGDRSGSPPGRATNPVGWMLLLPSICMSTAVGLVWLFRPGLRPLITITRPLVLEDLRKFIACTCICVYSTLQLALRFGVRSTAIICLFLYLSQYGLLKACYHPAIVHPISKFTSVTSISLIFISFISYLWVAFPTSKTTRMHFSSMVRSPRLLASIGIVTLFATVVLWCLLLPTSFMPQTHPVSLLIDEATAKHHHFVKGASSSSNLHDAVREYKRRYKRDPPPRFDKWYQFAKNKSSIIIDNFDTIDDDLHSYWAMTPSDLRYRTWEAVAYPGNHIAGIMVRDGKVFIGPRIPDENRWQVEGVGHIVQAFSEYLPDLDFAMNIEDEPRVAIPNNLLENLDILAKHKKKQKLPPADDADFSPNRAPQWKKFNSPIRVTRFDMRGIDPTFDFYGSAGCNESTPARSQVHWNRGVHCESCVEPHKMQQFIRDWHAAGDVCHQPDLAHLHGLHISPATFKVSRDLMPVFSKAKAPGYMDIRYPSEFAFMEKFKYAPRGDYPDPPFLRKEATLYWRGWTHGTTSVAERKAASWKGGHRQRFVYLMNHASSPSQGLTLLPTPDKAGFSYRYVNPKILRKYLQTDVGFPQGIQGCAGRDCREQFDLFKPMSVDTTDFQKHWSYRYIMDIDNLGASQKFIPYLQSNSLVFKSSIYREWWEDRVTPWKHFIPVDIRMTEIWSLLAYFAGWPKDNAKGDDGESQWLMPPHNAEGQKIAEAGRHWASRALRKEDMEVYLFRLLLEWARLTDDARDSIGYRVF